MADELTEKRWKAITAQYKLDRRCRHQPGSMR